MTSTFFSAVRPRERALGRVLAILLLGLLLALLLIAAAMFVGDAVAASAVWSKAGGARWPDIFSRLPDLGGTGAMIATLGAGFWLAAALIHRRSLRSFVTSAPRFRWRHLLVGLALTALLATGLLGLITFWEPLPASAPVLGADPLADRIMFASAILLLMPLGAFGEEIAVRGWLMQQMASYTRNPAILIFASAIVFSALHLSADALFLAVRIISGGVMAWAVIRLGGLEFAIGAHAARNAAVYWWLPTIEATGNEGIVWSIFAWHVATSLAILLSVELLARRGRGWLDGGARRAL